MFFINYDSHKKYQESLRYLRRKAFLVLDHKGRSAYILGKQGFIVNEQGITTEYKVNSYLYILKLYAVVLYKLFRK